MKLWTWRRPAARDDRWAELISKIDRQNAHIRGLTARIKRLERQTGRIPPGLDKLWTKVRHLEPGIQAVIRLLSMPSHATAYPERLMAQRFRLASQNQEDGITLSLLREIGPGTRRFVELGSGLSGGNSAVLAHELGWTGLMVDGDTVHIQQVARRFPGVKAVAAWITRELVNTLLTEHGAAGEIDLLSIDLDGNDYWIWEAITVCSPRIVIIEYNSMFGPERAVAVPYDPSFDRSHAKATYYGASLAAMTAMGLQKGYRLVAVEPTGVNAYFLRNDLCPHIPACAPRRAFRLMEKYDLLIQHHGEDIFGYVESQGLPLIDVATPVVGAPVRG